jgi:nicotinate-nucleotide adenylyltransferase
MTDNRNPSHVEQHKEQPDKTLRLFASAPRNRARTKHSLRGSSTIGLSRVGIYSGTFDPVHAGHIAFALQAAKEAKLDRVFLMPERKPRNKSHVTHYAHRVAMIRQAVQPHKTLAVLESEDRVFSTTHTLPRLQKQFAGATLVYICGSDVLTHMAAWPHVTQLLRGAELCIGLRRGEDLTATKQLLRQLPSLPRAVKIIESYVPEASSRRIRQAIRDQTHAQGLLQSVVNYAKQAWLYL